MRYVRTYLHHDPLGGWTIEYHEIELDWINLLNKESGVFASLLVSPDICVRKLS
jgi:hypothetical protein